MKKKLTCLEYALNLINKYTYTSFTMKNKLINKEYNSKDIEETISYLIKNNLINDEEYALDYASILLKKNKGPYYIKDKLISKGIAKSIVDRVVNNIEDNDVNKNLINVINKLNIKYKEKENKNIKIVNACTRMGYSYSKIIEIIKEKHI